MNSEKENRPMKLWRQIVMKMEQMRLEIFGAHNGQQMNERILLRPEDTRKMRGTQNRIW